MAVNRSNVAVTDTFDTWRIRTNEVNTTLNQATNAITANTIIFRDNDSSYIANAATLNTVSVTHNTTTTALSVTSALAASADGSKASILTTGGIYSTLTSKFAADLTIGTDLTIDGNTVIGSASGDIVSVNATLSTNVIPTSNVSASGGVSVGNMLGSTAKNFAHIFNSQQTITAAAGITAPTFSVASASGAANTATLVNNALTTGTILSATSTSTDTGTRKIVQITNDAAAAVGTTALSIQSDGGRGIFVDSNLAGGLPSLQIDSAHTTANAVIIDSVMTTGTVVDLTASALTTGSALFVESTGASTGTRNVVDFRQENASATGSTVLNVLADEGFGVKITSTAATSNASLDIVSSHTTKNTFNITSAGLTTGSALSILSTGTHSSNLVSFVSDGAATGPTLFLRNDATAGGTKILQVANSSADVFSVTQAGDATIGNDLTIAGDFVVSGNLSVAGATTEINTATTIVRDKTLVLGTKDSPVTGAIYTAANPPVITTTSNHGLDNGDVLFVVTSSGTAITAEQLIVVSADNGSNQFTPTQLDGSAFTGSGDSTTRTISYTGPQTDALVDDAGIYIPGSSAIHTFKWDDTLNNFETNASLRVNDTSQFVLPNGTLAQKPAAAIVGNVPAATTGAMRYNSTNSKIEAVTVGTTYENISTETFATAIAIALG